LSGAESIQVKLNYYAMAVAILAECSVETAFEKLQCFHPDKVGSSQTLTSEDTEDMRKFRGEGMSYQEIAQLYDAPWTTVHGRIRPREGKVS
jgi:hypothetical protein